MHDYVDLIFQDFNGKRGYSRANQYTLFLCDNKNMPGIKISKHESLRVEKIGPECWFATFRKLHQNFMLDTEVD